MCFIELRCIGAESMRDAVGTDGGDCIGMTDVGVLLTQLEKRGVEAEGWLLDHWTFRDILSKYIELVISYLYVSYCLYF